MMRLFAYDAGVLWLKATDGVVEFAQPSVIGPKADLLFEPPADYLALHEGGQAHFVGHSAVDQSRFRRWLRQDDKARSTEYRAMMMTAAGSVLGSGHHTVGFVCGLPISHWNQKETVAGVVRGLSGTLYSVSRGSHAYNVCLHIEDVMVLPQPYGSIADATLNRTGESSPKLVETRRGLIDLAVSRALVVEVGSHTCHLLVVDRMKPLVSESKCLPYGIAAAYEAIGAGLNGLPAWEVDRRLREGTLKTDGTAFRDLAVAITAEARGMNANVDLYFVSGGGGERLYPYLLDKEPKLLHDRPFFGNLWGFWKLGARKWVRRPIVGG